MIYAGYGLHDLYDLYDTYLVWFILSNGVVVQRLRPGTFSMACMMRFIYMIYIYDFYDLYDLLKYLICVSISSV